jgi:hypothetical protein
MNDCPPRFAWVLNLDAELELAGGPQYAPRARLLAQLEQFVGDARRLLGPDDVLLPSSGTSAAPRAARERRGPIEAARGRALVGRTWCPTPRALAALEAAGVVSEPHPGVDVVQRVNHRRFAFELGGGLEGQRYIEDKAVLDVALRRAQAPLLLKRPLAFAGRGQTRVYAHAAITAKEWSWIEASLESDGLIVEPLVEPTLEVSLHGFVWRDARFELGRVCVQDVSTRGVFRAVRRAEPGELSDAEQRSFVAQGEHVATALASTGYFGPFGIDGYRYRLGDRIGFCTLGEINARYTMGFAVGFPRPASELVLS